MKHILSIIFYAVSMLLFINTQPPIFPPRG